MIAYLINKIAQAIATSTAAVAGALGCASTPLCLKHCIPSSLSTPLFDQRLAIVRWTLTGPFGTGSLTIRMF